MKYKKRKEFSTNSRFMRDRTQTTVMARVIKENQVIQNNKYDQPHPSLPCLLVLNQAESSDAE